ncbi:MAG: hypothetical protein OQK72_11505 [Gammaproteobacteria bacterium]|nr:hypothetical protein [Gammaproteobacteria bacterium]MCW9005917.1 hypothetical protein [Gammaproteobacteria bacterium]MCW9055065.1 hypothetical protein [Gammaproteobacteria bacterium]
MFIPIEQLISILIRECHSRRNTIFLFFVVISLASLALGTIWPKKYTAFAIIHVDNTNILQPLMRGAAEATQSIDHVSNAREIIFGERIMDQVLEDAGWLDTDPSDIEQEKIKNEIKDRIEINEVGENLLKVEYLDEDSLRAFITTKRLVELFIKEGEKSKVEESQSAYNFIEKQVNEYLQKLTKVEEELREFRSGNPNARPGLEAEVSNRISRLQQNIEETDLLLREASIRKDSLVEQLSGEAAITISQTTENQYRKRILESQGQLEILRLDYKETYPDIVRLKHQIEELKQALISETRNREEAQKKSRETGKVYLDEAVTLNPFYQELRSNLSGTETEIATLKTRIDELNKMLETEYDRAKNIYGGEATLTKLTRNYQVNQEIYQDLLRRLENARVSKNLDEEQQGLTFKVQEPAKIPLLPTGLRFLHFALGGLVLGLVIPVGIIYFMLQLDPRIRFSQVISTELGLPLLAEIDKLESLSERRSARRNYIYLSVGVIVVLLIYGYVGWLKFTGIL